MHRPQTSVHVSDTNKGTTMNEHGSRTPPRAEREERAIHEHARLRARDVEGREAGGGGGGGGGGCVGGGSVVGGVGEGGGHVGGGLGEGGEQGLVEEAANVGGVAVGASGGEFGGVGVEEEGI